MAAPGAGRHMPAERLRAAGLNGRHHFELAEANMPCIGPPPRGTMFAENVSDLQPGARQLPRTLPGSLSERTAMQGFERFKWAYRVPDRLGRDFGISGSRAQLGVTEKHLNDPDIRPRFQKMGGKAVPQGMQRNWL